MGLFSLSVLQSAENGTLNRKTFKKGGLLKSGTCVIICLQLINAFLDDTLLAGRTATGSSLLESLTALS